MRDLVRSLIREVLSGFDMVLYHGTKSHFEKFDLSFFNSGSGDGGWLGKGFYFTNDEDYAESYAHAETEGSVLECRVRLRNPLILSDPVYSTSPLRLAREFGANNSEDLTRILKDSGYDGVVLTEHADKGRFVEACVFDASNVEIIGRTG